MGWLSGWTYRKSITILHTDDAIQPSYQMFCKVYRSTGTDGTEAFGAVTCGKVYVSTKCESDYDDIRFTTSDGTTLLPYFILPEQANSSSAIMVVMLDVPAHPDNFSGYIYYGNAGASAYSSGSSTFPTLFDHFSSYSGWTNVGGTWQQVTKDSKDCVNLASFSSWPCLFHKDVGLSSNLRVVSGQCNNGTTSDIDIFVRYADTNNWAQFCWFIGASGYYGVQGRVAGSWVHFGGLTLDATLVQNTWYTVQFAVGGSSDYKGSVNAKLYSFTHVDLTSNTKIGLGQSGTTTTQYFDYIGVGKYTTNEPTWSTWGTEEAGIPMIIIPKIIAMG